MTRDLVRRALELLASAGPIVVAPPSLAHAASAHAPLAPDGVVACGALCSFVGERVDARGRRARLDALARRLPPGAPLVVIDHNQPRQWWGRALGGSLLILRGLGPARARHPTARELRAHGFVVSCLRLACGERVQLVLTSTPPDRAAEP